LDWQKTGLDPSPVGFISKMVKVYRKKIKKKIQRSAGTVTYSPIRTGNPESIPLYFRASCFNLRRMIKMKILINSAMKPIMNDKVFGLLRKAKYSSDIPKTKTSFRSYPPRPDTALEF
jgi:hypothetical protein